MVSIDDLLQEVPHELFKEPIIRPLKFKMGEICRLENREVHHISLKHHPILMEIRTQMHIWNSMTVR